MQELAVKPPL